MKRKHFNPALLVCAVLFATSCKKSTTTPPQSPDKFSFETFSTTDALKVKLAGEASFSDGNVVLNTSKPSTGGSAYYSQMVTVDKGFESSFSFTISELGGVTDANGQIGGDGFSFVLFNNDTGALKSNDWWGVFTNGLYLDMDTFMNYDDPNDPNGNHINLYIKRKNANGGTESTYLGTSTSIPEVSDGNVHTLKIVYANKKVKVFADGNATAALSVDADLSTLIQLDNGKAFVSVNSFSGVAYEKQTLNSWQFKAY